MRLGPRRTMTGRRVTESGNLGKTPETMSGRGKCSTRHPEVNPVSLFELVESWNPLQWLCLVWVFHQRPFAAAKTPVLRLHHGSKGARASSEGPRQQQLSQHSCPIKQPSRSAITETYLDDQELYRGERWECRITDSN